LTSEVSHAPLTARQNSPPARRWRRRLTGTVLFGAAALTLAPLISLLALALSGEADIWAHLFRYVLPRALVETAGLLFGVALVAGSIGVTTAWLITAHRFPGRDLLAWLLPLPLAVPTYLVAYVYGDLLSAAGPVQTALRHAVGARDLAWFPEIRSVGGAALLIGLVLYPYVFLTARATFLAQSGSLIDAARTLGAGRSALLWHVVLPLARPALAVGLSLVLLETLNDIGASEYLGVRTLTLAIFTTWLNRGSLPAAAQMACAMLLVVSALIALERYGRRHRGFADPERQPRPLVPISLRGPYAFLAALACALPVTFGFAVPAAMLCYETMARGLLTAFDPALLRYAGITIALAASATALALALGVGAAAAARLRPRPGSGVLLTLAGLGYAVPGTVLALGLLSPLLAVDTALNWVSRGVFGVGVGLVVVGSGAALVIAYVVRFLAIATGSAQAGFARIPTHMDDAARILGAGAGSLMRNVHLPLLRPAIAGAALLTFVDCLKELPASLLLRPLNVETLSTYIYQFATRGNFEEGALAALLIVAAGIPAVIWTTRYADALVRPSGSAEKRRQR
jgi:iron(III) transport system permease protein